MELPKLQTSDIDLVVYDFDGVMTDNRVLFSQDGTESVIVNRGDGLGVEMIKKMNVPQVIISTEKNPVVCARAKKIGLPVFNSCSDKKATLLAYCQAQQYEPQKVVYVGNDVNDLEAMNVVGVAVAPADAHPVIKEMAHIVLRTKGGDGVVRELADMIN